MRSIIPGTNIAITPRRILVVEDHESTARVLEHLLQRHGHQVWTAFSYQQALELALTHPVEVLVCDLGLPDGNGFDLLKAIQAEKSLKSIVLSGCGTAEDLGKTKAAGFDAHLVKPLDVTLLEQTMARLLD